MVDLAPIRAVLGESGVLTSKEDLEFYGKDSCKEFGANSCCVLLPKSQEELQKALALCNQIKLPVVPSGGRTGYSGGATATSKEAILSLEKLNKILEVDPIQATLRCQAGVVTARIQEEARKSGLYYPVDFGSSGSSQIGGNLATNAGGIRVIRYGLTRDQVVGLKAVLPDGTLLEWSDLIKNQTGYDLRHLLIGSEGTLAVITEATLRLHPFPKGRTVLLAGIEELAASLQILKTARSKGLTISALECFSENGLSLVLSRHKLSDPFSSRYPWYLILEIEGDIGEEELGDLYSELSDQGLISDAIISQNSKQFADLWALRELISESISAAHVPHKNDLSVPISKIPEFVTALHEFIASNYPGTKVVIFGHVGDGNLHVNILKPESEDRDQFFRRCREVDERIFALVRSFRGSISAEHGVGLLKKEFLHYSRSEREIELMRGIKRSFDPNNILNPGKIF